MLFRSDLDERDNAILDQILGDDDEGDFGESEPKAAQTEDSLLDQILDGKVSRESEQRRGMEAAERRRQDALAASNRGGRVGMPDRPGYSGFEILR